MILADFKLWFYNSHFWDENNFFMKFFFPCRLLTTLLETMPLALVVEYFHYILITIIVLYCTWTLFLCIYNNCTCKCHEGT